MFKINLLKVLRTPIRKYDCDNCANNQTYAHAL